MKFTYLILFILLNGLLVYGQSQTKQTITWHVIDTGRFLSAGNHGMRPLAYDPDLNLLTHVHQRGFPPIDSGGIGPLTTRTVYYSYSTDAGFTWTRIADPVNYPDPDISTIDEQRATSAWPTNAIFNPDNSLSTAWWYGTWMGDATGEGEYQDAMWVYDYPMMSNTAVNTRKKGGVDYPGTGLTSDTWFYDGGPHYAFTSKTAMFDLYSVMDDSNFSTSTKIKRGIARYDGTGAIDYYVPATWDTMAWNSFGDCFGGDAIEVGGVKKVAACWFGLYNDYQNYDSGKSSYRIAVSYSDDVGLTFGAWDTIPLSTISGLGTKRNIWSFDPSNKKVNGSFLLDSLGYPHVFTVLQSEPFGTSSTDPVVAELYKDNTGWKGKWIGPLHAQAHFIYGGFNYFGCELASARNKEGTAFFVQYTSAANADEADIFASGRLWNRPWWEFPANITQTPGLNETVNHLAQFVRDNGGKKYTIFSSYVTAPNENSANVSNAVITGGSYDFDLSVNFDCIRFYPNTSIAGRIVTPDSTFTNMSVVVYNECWDEGAYPDSFYVRFLIRKGNGNPLYAESTVVPGVATEAQVFFPGGFMPPDTGVYTWESYAYILFPDSSMTTLTGTFTVTYPSNIAKTEAQKLYQPYQEITGTSADIFGDDVTFSGQLPFSFMYDGVTYDSFTVSTNGWVELGTIDTSESILRLHRREWQSTGGYLNEELSWPLTDLSTSPPVATTDANKVFGAWWDDMSTLAETEGGDSGDISYTTLGSTPNRIFIIQWKNMAARYENDNRSTRLNWQVRFFEKSNMLEFCYGPMIEGTFTEGALNSGTFGASIGLADTVRGPYHYFDVYKYLTTGQGYGDVNFLEKKLNPLIHWPGPDSAIRLHAGTTSCVKVNLNARWNLVSNPLCETAALEDLFPGGIIKSPCYEYKGNYGEVDSLIPGKGYFLKFGNSPVPHEICGCLPLSVSVELEAGWNLIGGPGHDVPAPPIGGIITGNTYGYNGSYVVATTMKPGKAYWVKSSGGTLNLGPAASPKNSAKIFDNASSITITDKNGISQTLYLSKHTEEKINPDIFEMPPSPPAGSFDVRFASSRILELYPEETESKLEFSVTMNSVEYPLTVSWNFKADEGMNFGLNVKRDGTTLSHLKLSGKGETKLQSNASLSLTVEGKSELPKEFSLSQNFPNPFNPVTTIRYALPNDAHVVLKIFDILGREVATLINEEQSAGYKSIEFDATTIASGIYFYKIEAGAFVGVKKMVLLK